jgi:hypothetical protein
MMMNLAKPFGATVVVLGLLLAASISASGQAAGPQAAATAKKSVWDGVFTSAQAVRGKAVYQEMCAECHETGEGPILYGSGFMRRWFEESLGDVFTKMRTQMPLNGPGTLPAMAYVDVLTFVLQQSGFPSGTEELTGDPALLSSIAILEKGGPGGPVPNFSLVQVVGCLTRGADKAWVVAKSSEPTRAADSGDSSPDELKASAAVSLGTGAFRLLDYPSLGRETRLGHKVQAKGFLIRQPNREDRLNPTALQTLAENCAE